MTTSPVHTPPSRWTHALMDELRMQTDPLADSVIERLFTEGKVDAVNQLMRTLVENDDLPSSRLPPYVREYLARTQEEVLGVDPEMLRQGQELFEWWRRLRRSSRPWRWPEALPSSKDNP